MSGMYRAVPLLLCAVSLAACGGGGPEPLRPIDVRTGVLLSDDNEGFPDSVTVVVRDQTAFEGVWSQAMAPGADCFRRGDVDPRSTADTHAVSERAAA